MCNFDKKKDSLQSSEINSDTWNFLAYADTSDSEVLGMLKSKIEELMKQQGTMEDLQSIWHHEYDWLMKSLLKREQDDTKRGEGQSQMHRDQQRGAVSVIGFTQHNRNTGGGSGSSSSSSSGGKRIGTGMGMGMGMGMGSRTNSRSILTSTAHNSYHARRRRYFHHRTTRRPLGFHDLKSISIANTSTNVLSLLLFTLHHNPRQTKKIISIIQN
ncbi:hypothetical protein RFI_38665 [Reticulomyxa filosa]|uniref:Uncharacterized protein n=1 Tax=Reticulomyxa filosa TaxID=46433 RepID=X6L9W3_RETFI|nr:hypothetical protein RFI_38665 [Reticulomyxa filosa]|eukprot:ETN98822.1 hypothetical protein RFI_38665 [Reticulomyxa filosa]